MDTTVFDMWLAARQESETPLSPSSVAVYTAMWRSLCKEMPGTHRPTALEIEAASDRLHLAPVPRRRYLQLMARVYGKDSPAQGVLEESALPSRGLPDALRPQDETLVNGALSALPLRDRALALLYLGAGLRTGESVRLQRIDLHLDDPIPWLHARDSHDEPVRAVPLNAAAANALRDWVQTHDAEFVFVGRTHQPLDVSSAWRICRQAVAKALGRTGVGSPRTMRHAFAVRNLAAGEKLKTVGEWIGHRQISSTERLKLLVPPARQPV